MSLRTARKAPGLQARKQLTSQAEARFPSRRFQGLAFNV